MSFMEAAGMGHSAPPEKVGIFCRHTAQPTLVVRARVSRAAFASHVRDALQELGRLVPNGRTQELSEIPFIAYHGITPETVAFEVGLPTGRSPARSRGDSLSSVPMGRYVSVSGNLMAPALAQAYQELADWCGQHKEHCTGPTYMTIVPGSGVSGANFLLQRRICAGPDLPDESCTGLSLLGPEASALAQVGLETLLRERACN